MRAIGYRQPGPLDRADALVELDLPRPTPAGHDILVAVKAVAVNPVDAKMRSGANPLPGRAERILGWDAAGVVEAVGPDVTRFKAGDAVYYAGNIARDGTNSEFHLVDERIVGRKPQSLGWGEAAALPLTTITAWETLFDRLKVQVPVPGAANAVLIIGGAGGVGSMAIQLARTLTDLTVIATASRPDTQEWAKSLGAHHVVDHAQPLAPQIAALGIGSPVFVFSTNYTERYLADIQELISPQGRFALIDDPKSLDIVGLKRKAVSVHWELMFTRTLYETADLAEQGLLLDKVARLVDEGRIKTTATQVLSPISVANLIEAHRQIESGACKGKIALEGWPAA